MDDGSKKLKSKDGHFTSKEILFDVGATGPRWQQGPDQVFTTACLSLFTGILGGQPACNAMQCTFKSFLTAMFGMSGDANKPMSPWTLSMQRSKGRAQGPKGQNFLLAEALLIRRHSDQSVAIREKGLRCDVSDGRAGAERERELSRASGQSITGCRHGERERD